MKNGKSIIEQLIPLQKRINQVYQLLQSRLARHGITRIDDLPDDQILTIEGGWSSVGAIKATIAINAKIERDLFARVIWGSDLLSIAKRKERTDRNLDNRKWAIIQVANTRKLCHVDNVTMKAYKTDGYEKTWIEFKKFTFIRWATGFDL